jgi:hypothetical protein
MKTLICLSLAVSALASPALSFAQSTSAPVTRAQVYADLVRLEQAGYDPSASNDPNYPAAIQAAEAKVAAQGSDHRNNRHGRGSVGFQRERHPCSGQRYVAERRMRRSGQLLLVVLR